MAVYSPSQFTQSFAQQQQRQLGLSCIHNAECCESRIPSFTLLTLLESTTFIPSFFHIHMTMSYLQSNCGSWGGFHTAGWVLIRTHFFVCGGICCPLPMPAGHVCCLSNLGLHNKRRYVSVCLSVCMLPIAGRTAGPIKTKLGIGTHVDPRSVQGQGQGRARQRPAGPKQ